MATITFKGNPVHTIGTLPPAGSQLPAFTLTDTSLHEVTNQNFKGKYLVMNIFPSVDTGVCAASVRQFNQQAAALPNVAVLCISRDLPFAHKRFCGAEGIEHVVSASDFRNPQFAIDYGVLMTDGPLAGLMSRAVVVADPTGRVIYTEQVPEIAQEPDYQAAINAITSHTTQ